MALKNSDDISEFGKRLYGLIADWDNKTENEEDRIRSPKGLAKKLYDLGLVHVNTKENFNSEYTNYNNAINSIEKKIVRHINSGVIKDQQGEFVIAYSRFFNCSSDYILGLSAVKSADTTVRGICDATNLSETAVEHLLETNNKEEGYINIIWSILMESDLYKNIPNQWKVYIYQLIKLYESEAILRTRKWERDNRGHFPVSISIDDDIEEAEEEVKRNYSACDGILYNMSRLFIGEIEKRTKDGLLQKKKEIDEEDLRAEYFTKKKR